MVTAELAACLPVLVLLLAVALSAVSVADVRVRAADASREAARLAARGDVAGARRVAADALPRSRLELHVAGGEVIAVVTVQARLLAAWLPSVTVEERAVAAAEPAAPP